MIIGALNNVRFSIADDDKAISPDVSPGGLNARGNAAIAADVPPESSVSSLAAQLATAAAYAAEKNKGLDAGALRDKAQGIIDQIIGPGYEQRKVRNDREVPATTDPAALARAKAATAFVNGRFADNVGSEPNPFAGLSPEQLATIAYDESGTFTVNERHAAWGEGYRLEENWRIQIVAKMAQEYNNTGKLTNFFKDVLEHYEQLPLMEQVQYPKDYARDLKEKIKRDFNYRDSTGLGGGGQDWVAAAKSFVRPMMQDALIAPLRPDRNQGSALKT